jgi:hypothetical protein
MIKLVVASHNFANVPKMLSAHFKNTSKEIHYRDRLEARKLFYTIVAMWSAVLDLWCRRYRCTNYGPWIPEIHSW